MNTKPPAIGMDFGTTNSSMAWYDSDRGEARVIKNAEDEHKTPSLVFFGEDDEILVGKDALNMIEEFDNSDDPRERDYVSQRVVRSIKRNLLNPPVIPIPGYGEVRPVEVVAVILSKLKQDAEDYFYEEIEHVVLTCPAIFGSQEREVLRAAAQMAGFSEVELLEEPTAAALAVHEQGMRIGKGVLIYDLGAGTFDLSVVARDEEGSLSVLETYQGPHSGGDDFDLALYHHFDRITQEKLGRPISSKGGIDLVFLRQCRVCKEYLSRLMKRRFATLLPSEDGGIRFRHELDRETFDGLIRDLVEMTVRKTAELWEQVQARVDTVVLIGGSSHIPLVQRRLRETLPLEPRRFAFQDYAVALGAAYYPVRPPRGQG